jgi:hypothetical protein
MKRNRILMVLAAVLALVAWFAPAAWSQGQGTPVTLSVSLPGGTNNVAAVSYAQGIAQPANSAIRVTAIEWVYTGTAATNGTLSVRRASGGPVFKTVAHEDGGGAGYSGVSFETNTWFIRRGESPTVTASITNAATVVIHGLEQ